MSISDEIVPLRVAQDIIDTMNTASELEGGPEEKAEFLLKHLQSLLNRSTYSNITLLEDLNRNPAPRVLKRLSYSDKPEYGPVFDDDVMQLGVDIASPLFTIVIPQLLSRPRVPFVIVGGEDAMDRPWVEHVQQPTLKENGYEDGMFAAWSDSENRAIVMTILQVTGTPPFTTSDRSTMSLMLRAIAPFVDREIFTSDVPLAEFDLTDRQREVLLLLLTGDSEKEVARQLHRSVHTVHTYVKQLYEKFEVSSRGELMANFIDESISKVALKHKRTEKP